MQKLPGHTRNGRGLALACALFYLIGLIAPGLHLALVEHVTCPVGGELMHADDLADVESCAGEAVVACADETSDDESDHERDSDPADHDQHSSCVADSARPAYTPEPTVRVALVDKAEVRATRVITNDARTLSIPAIARAPKNSPPSA